MVPHTPMLELRRPACGRCGTALPLCGIGWLTSMAFPYGTPGTDLAHPKRTMRLNRYMAIVAAAILLAWPRHAAALDQLCDSAFENCRTPLLDLIKGENVAIDVGMWFMEDARFSAEIIKRKQAGVPVRILMDPRSNAQHPNQPTILNTLAAAGIPMRKRTASGIEHWKIMVFEGQGVLYFGSANFSEDAFVPAAAYTNYVDETIYFTNNVSLLQSFILRSVHAW